MFSFPLWTPSRAVLTAALLSGALMAQDGPQDVRKLLQAAQGVEYKLVRAVIERGEVTLPDRPFITLQFLSDARVAGYAGVNRYFGSIELMPDGAFRWEGPGLATTRMAGDPALMELERRYLGALESTRLVQVSDELIQLVSEDSLTRLEFVRLNVTQAVDQLRDRELRLIRMVAFGKDVPLPDNPPLTLSLGQEGRFSGRAAVNLYTGSFAIEAGGGILFMDRVATTLMAGPPDLMRLEQSYLSVLLETQRLRPTPNGLILDRLDRTSVLEFVLR